MPLDLGTAVHDDRKPRRPRLLGSLLVDDAELHPDRPRAEADRVAHRGEHVARGTEQIHEVERRRVVEAGDDGLPMERLPGVALG